MSFKPFRYNTNKDNNNSDDTSVASEVSELSNPSLTLGGYGGGYYSNRFAFWIPLVLLSCTIFGFLMADYAGLTAQDRLMAEQLKLAKYSENQQQSQLLRRQEERNPSKGTVAYVLPIYTCPSSESINYPQNDDVFHNAALMLKASIHRQSYKNEHSGSMYDYEMIAIIHPSVIKCIKNGQNRADVLRDLGYTVQVRDEPIKMEDIQGEYLRNHAALDESDGIKELVRLHAYKLTEYAVVALVDLTTLVLQPPDDMFNLIVDGGNHAPSYIMMSDDATEKLQRLPARVDVVYTRDYTTVTPKQWTTGMNLSFLSIRPSMDAYNELVEIYTQGDYDAGLGWGGVNEYGPFAGSMTTKGLLTYYHTYVHPSSHVELHRCKYTNMVDAPRLKMDDDNTLACRDRKETNVESCTDCRFTSIDDVVIADMSECGAPWTCQVHDNELELCKAFHSAWFELRQEVEEIILLGDVDERRRGEPLETRYCGGSGSEQGLYVPLLLLNQVDEDKKIY